ncbi:MAG: hypothetical protein GX094_10220 [Clostridiales bacterium]|jgi:hypothetical protein|nr:hypothetical protein [Clostridiales bacterium]
MDIRDQEIKRLMQAFQSVQGKSEDELIRELVGMIKSGRGGITPKKAESIIRTLEQMVSPKQRRILEKLLRELYRG